MRKERNFGVHEARSEHAENWAILGQNPALLKAGPDSWELLYLQLNA